MTRHGIERRSPGPLANTQPTWSMSRLILKHIHKAYTLHPKDNNAPYHGGSGSNGIEGILQIPYNPRNEASQSDAV